MEYLRERQSPFIMYLHLAILTLALTQILVSNFMGFTDSGEISDNTIEFYGTWLHIISGLLIIPVTLVFITVLLKRNGFKYYFPYFIGNLSHLNVILIS
jgi:uncharacterized Tic20 family protein